MDRPDPALTARYVRFFRDAMQAHPVNADRHSIWVCRCGKLASVCEVRRASIRHGLVDPARVGYEPLPEDVPRHRPASYQEDQGSGPGWPNHPADQAFRERA